VILEAVSLDARSLIGQRTTAVASKQPLGMMMHLVGIMVDTATLVACLVGLSNVKLSTLQMARVSTLPSVAIMQMEMARQARCNPEVQSFTRHSGLAGFLEIVVAMATLTSLCML